MESEGIGSSAVLRRSARRLAPKPSHIAHVKPRRSVNKAKSSAMAVPNKPLKSTPNATFLDDYFDTDIYSSPGNCYPGDGFDPVLENRLDRRCEAEQFRKFYTYGSSTLGDGCNNIMEQKFLIRSHALDNWKDKSSGITWVAVYGTNSICVVTRREYLDMTRVGGWFKSSTAKYAFIRFVEALVSEIEDLADPSSEICQKSNWSISKPFAVVSVIPVCEESGHEAPSAVYYEDSAIGFLTEKFRSCSTFTYTETIQTAISAFQHLFGKEFTANDIMVTGFEEEDGSSIKGSVRGLSISDITKHLAVINRRE